MRILALDVGDVRIGVAASDPLGMMAHPLETIQRTGFKADLKRVIEIAEIQQASEIVAGMPLNLDGTTGPQGEKVLEFAEALRRRTRIPVVTWDERLSTVEVERVMIGADLRRDHRRREVDRLAATVILQSYLEAKRRQTNAEDSTTKA
jgi:putative Holliday junction resolvase